MEEKQIRNANTILLSKLAIECGNFSFKGEEEANICQDIIIEALYKLKQEIKKRK